MKRRYERMNEASKGLAEEAFKSYSGKRDYKRAMECYVLLSQSIGVPEDIQNYAKNMLSRLGKKIEDTHQ